MIARILLLAICAAAALSPTPARADYHLGSGDILEIAVFGVPDFKRRMTVNIDGDVSVPFLGEVHAADLSLGELRRTLTQRLTQTGTLRNPDVTIELVEHRPFYISGDVSRPGALPYRPGLTVRHAVALAGGYDALRFRAENPLLAAPEIRSQHDSLWTELVRQEARAGTLRAQIDGKTQPDLQRLLDAPVPAAVIKQISELEIQDLKLRMAAFGKERGFLERAKAQLDGDIIGLKEADRQQQSAIAQQLVASSRTADAQARGMVAVMRVDEERRSLATLRSQQVDTEARLAQAKKDREDLGRRVERLTEENQEKLTRELQNTLIDVEKLRNQIRSAGERLLYVGALKAQLRGGSGGPQLTIHRIVAGNRTSLPATEDSDILPGDVLDVLIRPEQLIVAPTQ